MFEKTIIASSTQTIFDLAVQLYGSADAVYELIANNPQIENIDSDITGLEITYFVNNTSTQNFFLRNGITAATKPANYANKSGDYLALETGGALLQEDGYKILM